MMFLVAAQLASAQPVDEAAVVPLAPPFSEGWRWSRVGPGGPGRMSDVAISPTDPARWAVAGLSGEIYLTLDAGQSWELVLAPLRVSQSSDDEDVLLDIESFIADLLGDIDTSEDPEATEEDAEVDAAEIEALVRQAAEQVRVDLQGDPWFFEQINVLRGRSDSARPRVFFDADGGRLVVGRADGLHVSDDQGASFDRLLDVPVSAWVELPESGKMIAGTSDGLRFFTEGDTSWSDPEDGTERLFVFDLVSAPEGVFAATSQGVWLALDAESWAPLPEIGDPVLAVLPDPEVAFGIWASTPDDLYRTEDGGQSWRASLGLPIRDVVDLVPLGAGQILASSSDGVYESLDAGQSWSPVLRGLLDDDSRGMAIGGGRLLLANDEGLFELVPRRGDEADEPIIDASVLANFPSVADLVDQALRLPGMAEVNLAPSRLLHTAMPRITTEFRYAPQPRDYGYNGGLAADGTLAGGNTLGKGRDATFYVTLSWTPAGRKGQSFSSTPDEAAERTWVMIDADGTVSVDDGGNPQLMAARITRRISESRRDTSIEIDELFGARARLVASRPGARQVPLSDLVDHELRVLEIEARLDALTDFAVSRWRAAGGRFQ